LAWLLMSAGEKATDTNLSGEEVASLWRAVRHAESRR
jgi:hypothetical protein